MFGLSDLAVKAIVAAVIAAAIFGGGMKLDHDIMLGKIEKIELQQKQEIIAAQQKQSEADQAAVQAASTEAQAQQQLAANLQKELANAKAHISTKTITATCVPYGFYRFLYAASHGVSVDSVALPAGELDGSCSPVGWSQLATEIGHNYGQALANSLQLDSLSALVKKQQAIVKEKK